MAEKARDSSIDQGPPPYPNDRERELALRVMSKHERGDGSTPALLTAIAKALATYRIELRKPSEGDHGSR